VIQIYIDDWECAHAESGFYLDVLVVPRVGEHMRIHRTVCSQRFLDDHKESFAPDAEIDGYGHFKVTEVQHSYGPGSPVIEIGVEPDI
jgi:hypothetical protein